MESDQSYSGSADTSPSNSSGSVDGEDRTELIKVLDQTIEVPQELCEDYSVFKEFFSMKTWEGLSKENKDHLRTFLPTFRSHDKIEKEKTLNMLFNKEPFHFSNPFNDFFDSMNKGNFRPEMVDMISALKETRDDFRYYKVHSYYSQLLPEVILSRERVLAAARAAPPGPVPVVPSVPPEYPESERYLPPHIRAKSRFYEELSAIRAEVGGETSDEDDGEPPDVAKKRRISSFPTSSLTEGITSTMGGGPGSTHKMDSIKKIIAAHKRRRGTDDDSPEMDTTGICLDDIKQRVGIGYDPAAKRPMFGGPKVETIVRPRKMIKKEQPSAAAMPLPPKPELTMTPPLKAEEQFTSGLTLDSNPILPNIKIKDEHEDDSDLHSLVDPMMSPPSSSTRPYSPDLGDDDFDFSNLIKDEPFDSLRHPLKLEDLDGIVYTSSDMMNLPIELADDPCDVLSNAFNDPPLFDPDESLSETTYTNFLCLVRALFPASSAHRASKRELQARCKAVMRSPIAPLNTWYNGSEDWCLELDSALDFLAGEWGEHPDDFVPYLQFIPETQMYQWIGAGRDGDQTLGRLCERWLRAAAQSEPSFYEPPPPKYPTSWVVRPPTSSEISEFRSQERRRFSAATKPFSYVQHGYRGVVGPCARAASCSAHSSLLTHDRPRHVTFMALVRDAVARLPNGEGSRHDILTMLKMTQYLASVDDQTLLSSISSTLDRLYTAKRDPVVKYDHRSAVWTYLHRNRTEDDWLKATVNRSRARKSSSSPRRKPPLTPKKTSTATAPTHTATQSGPVSCLPSAEAGDDGSDIDVDVDDEPGPAVQSELSSAQLLMQATRSNPDKVVVPHRPNKGKLVLATDPDTPSPPAKKPRPKPKARSPKSAANKSKRPRPESPPVPPKVTVTPPKATLPIPKTTISFPKTTVTAPKATVVTPKTTVVPPKTPAFTPKTTVFPAKTTGPAPKPTVTASITTVPASKPATKTIVVTPKTAVTTPKTTATVIVPLTRPVITQAAVTQAVASVVPPIIITTQPKTSASPPKPAPARPIQTFTRIPNKRPNGKPDTEIDNLTSEELDALAMPAPLMPPAPKFPHVNHTRSLLIKSATTVPTIVTASNTVPISSQVTCSRRGMFRLLSPAAPAPVSPKPSISQEGFVCAPPAAKKQRLSEEVDVSTGAVRSSPVITYPQGTITSSAASSPPVPAAGLATRTLQLPGGKTLQLSPSQALHLTTPQAMQLPSGHTLQLSSLQIPTQSVRLPNGQTVQLTASQPLRTIPASAVKPKPPMPTIKINTQPITSQPTIQIPLSSVQIGGQTVQLSGHSVHLGGHSMQLAGHTVKLSGGKIELSADGAGNNVASQLREIIANNRAAAAAAAAQAQAQADKPATGPAPSTQAPTHLKPTMQLTGHTVQLPSGQTLQLGAQTVQLPSGQTFQISSSAFHLTQALKNAQAQAAAQAQAQAQTQAHVQAPTQPPVASSQSSADKPSQQAPIIAKMLTNAQGQVITLESVMAAGRTIHLSGLRPQAQKTNQGLHPAANVGQVSAANVANMPNVGNVSNIGASTVRIVTNAAGARMNRPLLLTTKPMHNIILQQGDAAGVKAAASAAPAASQAIVISSIAPAATTNTAAPPVIKLHQVTPLQHIKLQGIKIQPQSGPPLSVSASTGVRNMLMEGQQLKLVGGRDVIARLLRPPTAAQAVSSAPPPLQPTQPQPPQPPQQ